MFADVAASVAAVGAAGGFLYARASTKAARDATASAERAIDLAVSSRQSSERSRLRHRVERVGELVHEISFSSQVAPVGDGLSQKTQGQCDVLNQAVIGLKNTLPKSTEVSLARSPSELRERAGVASVEIDRVLRRLATRRLPNQARGTFRHARRVPWHR